MIFFGSAPWDQRRLLNDLQIKSEKLRTWLRWNTLSVAVSISKGVVQDMDVYALSVDDKIANAAASKIAADRNNSPCRISALYHPL